MRGVKRTGLSFQQTLEWGSPGARPQSGRGGNSEPRAGGCPIAPPPSLGFGLFSLNGRLSERSCHKEEVQVPYREKTEKHVSVYSFQSRQRKSWGKTLVSLSYFPSPTKLIVTQIILASLPCFHFPPFLCLQGRHKALGWPREHTFTALPERGQRGVMAGNTPGLMSRRLPYHRSKGHRHVREKAWVGGS